MHLKWTAQIVTPTCLSEGQIVARIQMDKCFSFVSLFSSFFSSLQQGRLKKKQFVLDLSLDSWLYSGGKIPIRDASYITFLCLLFLVCVNFFDSSLSTSAGMCGMWCCSITGSLNVRSCRDKRTRRQKVNGATAMRGGAPVEEWPGGNACWEGSMAHLTPACPLLKLGRSVRTTQTAPRLAMRWSSCFRWVCTVGRVYLGWSVDVWQAGVVVAKRKSAHFLLLQRKSQQSGSFKLRFTVKSLPGCSFFFSYFSQYVAVVS